MPAEEAPGLSSVRIQRALRLNGIEDGRLQQSIRLLDGERQHSARLLRQDIRLVSLTLDYITTSSGASVEGRPSDGVAPDGEAAEPEPRFDRGNRMAAGKFRRAPPPPPRGSGTAPSGAATGHLRPQSSPNVGRVTGRTGGRPETRTPAPRSAWPRRQTTSHSGSLRAGIPKSAPAGFSRAGLGARDPPREKVFCNGIKSAIADAAARKKLNTEINDMLVGIRNGKRDDSRTPTLRQTPRDEGGGKTWAASRTPQTKHQNIMDIKKALHLANQAKLELRIKDFLDRIPPARDSLHLT